MAPDKRQTISWTNAGIPLIGPLETSCSEIWSKYNFSFKKMNLKTSLAKCLAFCLGLIMSTVNDWIDPCLVDRETDRWLIDRLIAVLFFTVSHDFHMESSIMTSSNGNISALLAFYAGNSPVTGEFHTKRPVTRSFDVFFDLRLNKPLSKQSWGWWFETLSRPLWRHCNVLRLSYLHSGISWVISNVHFPSLCDSCVPFYSSQIKCYRLNNINKSADDCYLLVDIL